MRNFRAILARESVETSEGWISRVFPAGCFDWRALPLTLTVHHDAPNLLGRIDSIERLGDLIIGRGVLDDEGEGPAAVQRRDWIHQIEERVINGISVEAGAVETTEECVSEDADGFCEQIRLTFVRYQIGAASVVTVPALEGTLIELDPPEAVTEPQVASDGVVASVSVPDTIPDGWLTEPADLPDIDAPDGRVPHVDGARVFGYLCSWADCFAGETEYVTEGGIRTLKETAGTVQRVLVSTAGHECLSRKAREHGGRWVDAEIRAFGVQSLMKVTLRRYGQTKEVFATPGHRWLVTPLGREGFRYGPVEIVKTADLTAGMRLSPLFPRKKLTGGQGGIRLSQFGVAHGFTFGDGSRRGNGCHAELYGAKDSALLPYFSMSATLRTFTRNGTPMTRVSNLPLFFKDLPPLWESRSYLYGWLAGYFAADGSVTPDGTPVIYSATRAHLEFYRDACARLGVGTSEIKMFMRRGAGSGDGSGRVVNDRISPLFRMSLIARTLPAEFFLGHEHRRRFEARAPSEDGSPTAWRVVSVEETERVEETYCAVVPGYENFTLMDNINVMNCHISFPNYCQTPWRSASGYAYAQVCGPFPTASGQSVRLAALAVQGGHYPTHGSYGRQWREAQAHYDDPTSCAAYVAVGENDHGIWFSGMLRSGVTDEQLALLTRHQPSGDWRTPAGSKELVGLCSVNVPGFVRSLAFAASGDGIELDVVAAVIGGGMPRTGSGCGCGGHEGACECGTVASVNDDDREARLSALEATVAVLTDALGDTAREALRGRLR